MRRLLLAGLVLLLLLCVPGRAGSLLARAITVRCSSTPCSLPQATPAAESLATPVPVLPVEEGWVEYCEPDEGFALALPEGWHRVDLDSPLLAGGEVRGLPGVEPVSYPSRPLQEGAGVPFFAYDLSPESVAGGFMANVNVLHRSLDSPLSAAEFGLQNLQVLEDAAPLNGPIRQETISLPAGEAMRFSYELGLVAQDSGLILAMTQLLLVRGQEGYVLTFATVPEQQERYAAVFAKIARSFRWLPRF